MSFFLVPVVRPRLYTRHILEDWKYQWNAGRRTYERVCYRPKQVIEHENNPIDSVEGMNLYPSKRTRLEDLDREVQGLMRSITSNREVLPEPAPRPPTPNFGRKDHLSPGDIGCPIVVAVIPVNVPAETSHITVTEPPASPDPVNSPQPLQPYHHGE